MWACYGTNGYLMLLQGGHSFTLLCAHVLKPSNRPAAKSLIENAINSYQKLQLFPENQTGPTFQSHKQQSTVYCHCLLLVYGQNQPNTVIGLYSFQPGCIYSQKSDLMTKRHVPFNPFTVTQCMEMKCIKAVIILKGNL